MSSFQTVAAEVPEWVERNFPGVSAVACTLGLMEEAGEVARAVLKDDQGIRGTHEEWVAEIRKELGDVFIKLADVARHYDIDLEAAVSERWAVIRQRDWQADRIGHGIGGAS